MSRHSKAGGEPAKTRRRKTVAPKRRNLPKAVRSRISSASRKGNMIARLTRELAEARKAEQQLLQSSAQFAILVQSIKDYAIYMLDRTGRIISWNRGAERIKGYTHDEIIGQHFSRFYTDIDRKSGLPTAIHDSSVGCSSALQK
jgi:PAS domain-containing protein